MRIPGGKLCTRVMPGLGLDYPSLKKINPKLVMTSISNFGQTVRTGIIKPMRLPSLP